MIACPNCNAPLRSTTSKFCAACGVSISPAPPIPLTVSAPTIQSASTTKWSWGAFLFHALWLCAHRFWLLGIGYAVAWIAVFRVKALWLPLFAFNKTLYSHMGFGSAYRLAHSVLWQTVATALYAYLIMLVLALPLAVMGNRLARKRQPDEEKARREESQWARAVIWGVPLMLMVRVLIGIAIGRIWPVRW